MSEDRADVERMRYSRHAVRVWRWQNEGKGDKAMKFKLTSLEKKWVLYDVGNSAFTMMVSTYFRFILIILRETPVYRT